MEKILTISIAAYNVENYIRETLDSLIDESTINELEIFVVDDGGTDKTFEISQEYAEKYPQSIFPIHKENGGYGSTINTSINLATGKYFKQLDGDDWYQTENLKALIEVMREVSVDCILTDFLQYDATTDKFVYRDSYNYIKQGEYRLDKSGIKNPFSMHTTAFKTKLLQDMPYRLSEHCFYTDLEYFSLPLPYIDTIYVLHKPIYVYKVGIEGNSMSSLGIVKHYKEHEKVFWRLVDVYDSMPKDKPINKALARDLLVNKISQHYRFLCILPLSKSVKQEMVIFTQKVQEGYQDLLDDAVKKYKLVKTLIKSKFLAYPLLSVWTKLKWGREED